MRKKDDRLGVLLRLPPELKHAIVWEVARRDSCMNDVLVSEIAAEYGVKFKPSAHRGYPGNSCRILIRMPERLKDRVQRHALSKRTNMTAVLVPLLARRLGVTIDFTPASRTSPFGGGRRQAA
jgi:hypothetical protein